MYNLFILIMINNLWLNGFHRNSWFVGKVEKLVWSI